MNASNAANPSLADKLPSMGMDEENQPVVQLPGLAEELDRMEKHARQLAADRAKGGSKQRMANKDSFADVARGTGHPHTSNTTVFGIEMD